MKIYFAGSIRGGRDDAPTYRKLIEHLKKHGTVLTEHVGSANLTNTGEKIPHIDIHSRDLDWLFESDVLVAEISTPSLGVGYEIGRAVENSKKILCLYSDNKGETVSGIIRGCPDLLAYKYSSIDMAKDLIDKFFSNFSENNS